MVAVSIIIVKGRPVSVNASSTHKNWWKSKVAAEATKVFATPIDMTHNDLRVTITFFYDSLPDFDTDNISKPICDALNGIAYHDDRQLMERNARVRRIDGSFRIKGVDPELVVAIAEGEDFVSIKIEKVGSGVAQI